MASDMNGMSNTPSDCNPFEREPASFSTAELIRLAADHELTPDLQAELDRRRASEASVDAQVTSGIMAEQRLRDSAIRALEVPAPSQALRESVAAIVAESRANAESVADGVEARSSETRDQSFWASFNNTAVGRSIGAMAAVFLVGFVLFIMGAPTGGLFGGTTLQAREVAAFIDREHNRCSMDPEDAYGKFTAESMDAIPTQFTELLGTGFEVEDLILSRVEGLTFVEAGRCRVPGSEGKSVHIRFETEGHPECPDKSLVSLFIQPDTGFLKLDEGKAYSLNPTGEEPQVGEAKSIIAWTRGGMLYLIVSDRAEACPKMLDTAGLPHELKRI